MSRVASITDGDMIEMDEGRHALNTKRVVKGSVKLFREFLGETCVLENFNKEELNASLRKFFVSVRRKDEKEVKKAYLDSLKYGICKHLKDNCDIDVSIDDAFTKCRNSYKAKIKDLKKKGKGVVTHKEEILREDLHKLFNVDNIAFNVATPCGLQNKVWFDIMFYLCRRGQENLREMTKHTFGVGINAAGRKYVHQIIDEADKNHGGDSINDDTIGEGKMFEQRNSPMSPVASYEKYLSKLHPELDALWQRSLDAYDENSQTWYCKTPLGRNSLGRMMPDISAQARLSHRYTNHCIRATSLCIADREGIEGRHMVRTSGHKSEASIRSYSRRYNRKYMTLWQGLCARILIWFLKIHLLSK